MVEQVDQGAVGAIHGLQGALGPGPLVGGEVGDVGVGVLQPGVGHQPGIDHQEGQAVDAQHPGHGEVGGGQAQRQQHRQKAEVRLQHAGAEAGREEGPTAIAEGGAVPEVGGGGAVVLAARHADEQIERPAEHQVGEHRLDSEQAGPEPLDRRFHAPAEWGLGPGGHMGFAAFELVAVGVVHRMAALPAEVGHQQQAVQGEAHRRLQPPVGMEGAVAAFMGQHPAAHGHRARHQPVEQPERGGRRRERDAGAEAVGQQRETKGEGQAAPGLGGLVLEQVGGQAGQQFGLGGVKARGASAAAKGRWGRRSVGLNGSAPGMEAGDGTAAGRHEVKQQPEAPARRPRLLRLPVRPSERLTR